MEVIFRNILVMLLSICVFNAYSKDVDSKVVEEPAEYCILIIGKWEIQTESLFQEYGRDGRVSVLY